MKFGIGRRKLDFLAERKISNEGGNLQGQGEDGDEGVRDGC